MVYKWDTAFNYTVLHNFTAGPGGGANEPGVIRDSAGNLYGTAPLGGTAGYGVVFELDSAGNYTVLYNFTGGADGAYPAGVIRDSAGNLYGTAPLGGTAGDGVVFELDSAGNFTVLYTFTGGTDGGDPQAGVVRDPATGNLYGTTAMGGGHRGGVVYKLDADGDYTVLHRFTQIFASPNGVILTPDGLYGTTAGGRTGRGVVYKLDSDANYTVLYNFTGGADGDNPQAGVIRDSAGNLYGTTESGGAGDAGVVFKLDSAGNYTVLYNFTGGADGGSPRAGVVLGPTGNLIGTTGEGGKYNGGVMFELTGVQ